MSAISFSCRRIITILHRAYRAARFVILAMKLISFGSPLQALCPMQNATCPRAEDRSHSHGRCVCVCRLLIAPCFPTRARHFGAVVAGVGFPAAACASRDERQQRRLALGLGGGVRRPARRGAAAAASGFGGGRGSGGGRRRSRERPGSSPPTRGTKRTSAHAPPALLGGSVLEWRGRRNRASRQGR